ncbi:hypothetical protein F4804DRAFT_213176 [Jackrogersella minutella]|nr:hypothetical protein F4804DRAFT_213176 [Jackrogersella minutella]
MSESREARGDRPEYHGVRSSVDDGNDRGPDGLSNRDNFTAASDSSRNLVKSETEQQARVRHRAHAYDALSGTNQRSKAPLKKRGRDSNRPQRYPASLRPGSTALDPASVPMRAVSEHSGVKASNTRLSSSPWKPQTPAYIRISSGSETQNDGDFTGSSSIASPSRFVPYRPARPPPPPPQQQRPKPEPSSQSNRKPRPPPLELREASARGGCGNKDVRGVQSFRIGKRYEVNHDSSNHDSDTRTSKSPYKPYRPPSSSAPPDETPPPASAFTGADRCRRLLTPPPSSSPSAPMYSAFSVPAPAPKSPGDRSPSWGAWTSDHPQQPSPSLVDRFLQRARTSIHSNMQKAGLRPLSSFEVHSVRKVPVEDVAAWSAPLTGPTKPPLAPGERRTVSIEGGNGTEMTFEIQGRSGNDVEGDKRRSFAERMREWEENSHRKVDRRSEDISGLEDRARRHRQRQRQVERRRQPELSSPRARAQSASGDADRASRDSLFLGRSASSAVSGTFFASEWSQRQTICQAQEVVASLPASSSFHHGPFAGSRPRASSDDVAQGGVVGVVDPGLSGGQELLSAGVPFDNRRELPSQARESSYESSRSPNPGLRTSLSQPTQPSCHMLARKKGNRSLR